MWQRERWKIERKKANRRGWDLHDFRWQMEASQTDTQRWGYTWRRATGHNRTCGHQERPLSCQLRWHRGPLGPCQPGAGMCQSTWQTNQHWNYVWNALTAVIGDVTHTHTHWELRCKTIQTGHTLLIYALWAHVCNYDWSGKRVSQWIMGTGHCDSQLFDDQSNHAKEALESFKSWYLLTECKTLQLLDEITSNMFSCSVLKKLRVKIPHFFASC